MIRVIAALALILTTSLTAMAQTRPAVNKSAPQATTRPASEQQLRNKVDEQEKEILRLRAELAEAQKRILEVERKLETLSKGDQSGKGDRGPYYPLVDNGDGTITDTRTKLVWQRTPVESDMVFSKNNGTSSVREARDRAGLDATWGVPSIEQLESLYSTLGAVMLQRGIQPGDERLIAPFEWPTSLGYHWYWSSTLDDSQDQSVNRAYYAFSYYYGGKEHGRSFFWWDTKLYIRFVKGPIGN